MIAGDFLESLGKELGLEVPPDLPHSESKVGGTSTRKDGKTADKEEKEVHYVENSKSAADFPASSSAMVPETLQTPPSHYPIMREERMKITNDKDGTGTDKKDLYEKVARDDKKEKSTSKRHHSWSSDSSGNERRRKHRHHRHRSTSSDDDSSDDYEDRHHSRTKEKRKRSSHEKSSSSRRRSKHHKHRDKESSERHSRHSSRKERGETKDRLKYKD